MTCKDCIHYAACMQYTTFAGCEFAQNFDQSDILCDIFKDKSRFIETPCKVGDTVYFDTYLRGKNVGIQPHKVINSKYVIMTEPSKGGIGAEISAWEFGKTVFLTREAAEKAFKEREQK